MRNSFSKFILAPAIMAAAVLATIPALSAEERARVAEHLLAARPNAADVAEALNAK